MKSLRYLILSCLLPIFGNTQSLEKQLIELDSAFSKGDYAAAEKWVEKINTVPTTTFKHDTVYIEYLNTAGTVYYRTEQYDRASAFFVKASDLSKTVLGEQDYRWGLAVFNLASCYKEMGRYAEAEPLYLKSLPVLATAFGQSSVEYTRCFYTLGSMYIEMKKYPEAESMIAAAVNFYKAILGQESDDYLGALGAMGVVYQGQGKYDKSEEIYLALKNYHLTKPVSVQRDQTLQILENNLGELYRHMGDYEKAEAALQNAVKMAKSDPLTEASALNNLALVQKAMGNYSNAERSYKRSIQLYKSKNRTDHPDYTNPVNNMGELFRVMGRWQEAVYAFEEVIQLRERLLGTDHPNYANAVNNLALVQFAVGRYEEAEKNLVICRDIYKKTLGEKDRFYANSLNNLASVYKVQGKLKEAETNYKECLRVFKETHGEEHDKYAIYLGGLGGTYREMKNYDESIRLTLRSLEILKKKLGEHHYDHIETEYNLAETYREAGKFEEAEKHYHRSLEGYLKLIQKYFPYLSEKEKTSFYFNVANAFETFNSYVIQVHQKFPAKKHQELVNRMFRNQVALKSLLLHESSKLQSMAAQSTDAAVRRDFAEWLKLRDQIVQHYRLSEEERQKANVNLVSLESAANDIEQGLASALQIRGSSTLGNQGDIEVSEIHAALGVEQGLIEIVRTQYFEGRWTDTIVYSALILTHTDTIPRFVLLNDGNVLEGAAISGYRRSIRSRTADEQAYKYFWKPLETHLEDLKSLIISPDGVYNQVNLQTLRNPESKKFLLEEKEISLVSGIRNLTYTWLHNDATTSEIFSGPQFDLQNSKASDLSLRFDGFPDMGELPGTLVEADSISKLMKSKNWSVTLHQRKEADEQSLKRIQSPRVLHIATHGFFLKDVNERTEKVMGFQTEIARDNPLLRSGLVLAGAVSIARDSLKIPGEDGILTALEVAGLDLNKTDLVVLSACETGLGEVLNGQGVYGLQRSFLVAGAKTVIMSLWKIDDQATQQLMTFFYREWLKDPSHLNKTKAFRKAQLQLKEIYPDPFFWGSFVLVR